jgi:hypothetical protein
MQVPFVPILVGLLAVGLLLLVLIGLRVRGSVRRFGLVRGALDSYLADRAGLLKARSAALGVAFEERKQHPELGIGR